VPSEIKPESEDSLPEDATDRTKEQFAKLTEKNKELASKLELLEKVNAKPEEPKLSALERLRGPASHPVVTPTAPVAEPEPDEPLADENGYLDEARLKKGLDLSKRKAQEAEERAKKAQETADAAMRKIEEYEVGGEKKRVHSAFPEIDPYSEKFNPKLYDQVSKDMLWNLVNVGKEDFYATAEKVVSEYRQGQVGAQQAQLSKQEQTEKLKQEVQEPSRSGSVSMSRKEELMRDFAIKSGDGVGRSLVAEVHRSRVASFLEVEVGPVDGGTL
jgi:hypothetical protein